VVQVEAGVPPRVAVAVWVGVPVGVAVGGALRVTVAVALAVAVGVIANVGVGARVQPLGGSRMVNVIRTMSAAVTVPLPSASAAEQEANACGSKTA
jgi:hypothetical protein